MKTFNEMLCGNKSITTADEQFEKAYQSFMNGEAPRYAKAIDFVQEVFDTNNNNQHGLFQVAVAMAEALMSYKQKLAAEKAYADTLRENSSGN